VFNIDAQFIERLKAEGYDLWTISQWEKWLELVPETSNVVQQIRDAFSGLQLGSGVGLREANGLDDYADESELVQLRKLDERTDWRKLDADLLNRYYCAPTFFDARGFVFHLPAFLIAELDDRFDFPFIDRIIEKQPTTGSWIDLLTATQAEALANVLLLVKQHPDYYNDAKKFDHAINRFNEIAAADGG
jgi:hypothetical protein